MAAVDYGLQCSALRDAFSFDAAAVVESGRDYSWAEVAAVLEIVHKTFESLDPPPELDDYHRASLDFMETYTDVARSRPADQSFVRDYSLFTFSVLPGLVQVAQDGGRTEEERTEKAGAFMEQMMKEHFGAEFLAAHVTVGQALDRLPAGTRTALRESGCPMGNP